MAKNNLKWGLLGVIILQILSIFYMINIYHKFVDNPDNYYKTILVTGKEETRPDAQSKFN